VLPAADTGLPAVSPESIKIEDFLSASLAAGNISHLPADCSQAKIGILEVPNIQVVPIVG
jgi:hypothetical protein